jgi:hypothetical protein
MRLCPTALGNLAPRRRSTCLPASRRAPDAADTGVRRSDVMGACFVMGLASCAPARPPTVRKGPGWLVHARATPGSDVLCSTRRDAKAARRSSRRAGHPGRRYRPPDTFRRLSGGSSSSWERAPEILGVGQPGEPAAGAPCHWHVLLSGSPALGTRRIPGGPDRVTLRPPPLYAPRAAPGRCGARSCRRSLSLSR